MFILKHLWIILALPLAGSAINFIFGSNWPKRAVDSVGHWIGIADVSCGDGAVREFLRLGRRARFPG